MSLLDDAYVSFLNLDKRKDRRERMWRELARVGIPAERTRGGQMWQGDPQFAPVRIRASSTPGSEGCSVGQMNIMARALELGKHALVMEDDLVFCSDFHERLKIIEPFLDKHRWDVFWFGATFHVPAVWHKDTLGRDVEPTSEPRIVRTYGCWSTYCYLVNRESLVGVLEEHVRCFPASVGIDTTFIELQPDLHTYAFVPGCVKQYDNYGDVGGGWTAFSEFSKLGPYWWQDRMEDFDSTTFDWVGG